MPIVRNAVVSHTLVNVQVDIPGAYMVATFRKDVDGQGAGFVPLRIEGPDMMNIIGAPAHADKARADDITDAVYAFAIASNAIAGEIA